MERIRIYTPLAKIKQKKSSTCLAHNSFCNLKQAKKCAYVDLEVGPSS